MAKIHPKQREKVADLLRAGLPVIEAAQRARMSITTARAIGHWLGLTAPRPKKAPKPPRPPRPPKTPKPERRPRGPSPWQHGLALSLLRDGATCAAVAEGTGISGRTAAKIARMYGLRVRPRGRAKGAYLAPAEDRARAVVLVAQGRTLRAAAADVGASHESVRSWCREAGVAVGKGRKGKTKTGATREPVTPPAQPGAKTVTVRGVTLAKVAVVERSPEMA